MAIEDTGWRKPEVTQAPGEAPKGLIHSVTGMEAKPCFTCCRWEKNPRKLVQHFRARGLKPDVEGYYETPIAQEIEGRKSLKIHPRDFGYCRFSCYPTHMNATCADWQPTRFAKEMALKLVK